jgi:glycosyltransferase involved in cell wall biosynthesis
VRVLVLADVFFPDTIGGAGRVARQLAEGLAREAEVVVVSRNVGGSLPAFEQAGNLEIHRFFVDRSTPRRFLKSALQNAARVTRKLTHDRLFDRLVIHQPLSGIAGFGLMRTVPTMYVFHSPWAEEYRTQIGSVRLRHRVGLLMRNLVEGALIRRAERVMVLSAYMACELRRAHRTPPRKVTIVPGGVDLDWFSPGSRSMARTRLGLPQEADVIVTVRNLMPRMGLQPLIEAFAQLLAERPGTHLVIAGDGPLKTALEEQVARAGLGGRVHLLGAIPEELLPEVYRAGDVFVMATRALEGFGLATVEALACGTPVVATPVGASPEILGQLDRRLVADSSSPASIAAALASFLARPQVEKEQLAARGRGLCLERYSWPAVTERFNELVGSLG